MTNDPVARLLAAIEKRARTRLGAIGMMVIVVDLLGWWWTGEPMCAAFALQVAVFVFALPHLGKVPRD